MAPDCGKDWNGKRGRRRSEQALGPQGVGFEVKPGELVGIIGSNGAGKSTLLKVLSQITEPTTAASNCAVAWAACSK